MTGVPAAIISRTACATLGLALPRPSGVAIGMAGVAAGIALGALVSVNLERIIHQLEKVTGMQFLDAKVYFMSDLPAQVRLGDVLQVALVALVLCLLATIYPAWRASRVLPAEALRHD